MSTALVWLLVGLRFVLPLFAFRRPLLAIAACLALDAADQTLLDWLIDEPLARYQAYDKALDVHYLTIAYFTTMRNWRDSFAFGVGRALYLYRLFGVFLFELVDRRWLLVVFANTFEYAFIAYEAVRTRWEPRRLTRRHLVTGVAVLWVGVKLPQEWWLHIAQLDVTDVLADHPWAWSVVVAVVAVSLVVWRVLRSRLPAPDWSFTLDVDRRQPGPVPMPAMHDAFFTMVLAEKVVLLVLICEIFASVLPDVEATDIGLVLGVALLVVLNAGVTQLQRRRRDVGWANVAEELAATTVITMGIVAVDAAIGTRRVDTVPAPSTVFFVVLLSVLIALYDRYRQRHGVASPPARRAPVVPRVGPAGR